MNSEPIRPLGSVRYLNLVLTVIAVLLTVHLFRQPEGVASVAMAQNRGSSQSSGESGPANMPNAAEQRARMIRVLDDMSSKIAALDARLSKGGFEVKVTEMPEVRIKQ